MKALTTEWRYVRPLTEVASVGDVALVRGWDGHVDLGAPGHVRTHAEQVPQLCRRQGRVFVLRGKTGQTGRAYTIGYGVEKTESHYCIFKTIRILIPYTYSTHIHINSIMLHGVILLDCYSLHRTCQTAAGGTGDLND